MSLFIHGERSVSQLVVSAMCPKNLYTCASAGLGHHVSHRVGSLTPDPFLLSLRHVESSIFGTLHATSLNKLKSSDHLTSWYRRLTSGDCLRQPGVPGNICPVSWAFSSVSS